MAMRLHSTPTRSTAGAAAVLCDAARACVPLRPGPTQTALRINPFNARERTP
jgi:hypothetical protein